jgi:predicted DNA-binding transcriptional regulator YafY
MDRVRRIDELLRRQGEKVTLIRLAEVLGVTPRTVCRDLDFMKRELGLPLAHTPRRAYHYAIPVPPLDSSAAMQIAGAKSTLPTSGALKRRQAIEAIHQALYSNRKLQVLLTAEAGEDSGPFVLHPFFLSKVAGEWVLFAFREQDRALVNIPARHCGEVKLLDETFADCPAGPAKMRGTQGWLSGGKLFSVTLRFAHWARWAERLILAPGQTMWVEEGEVRIRFRTDDLEQVRRLVLFMGDGVTVEEPAVLRSILRFHLLRLLRSYNPLPQDSGSASSKNDLR